MPTSPHYLKEACKGIQDPQKWLAKFRYFYIFSFYSSFPYDTLRCSLRPFESTITAVYDERNSVSLVAFSAVQWIFKNGHMVITISAPQGSWWSNTLFDHLWP